MENASKALLMAATVLVGVLLLSLGVYLFTIFGDFSSDMSKKLNQKNIDEFNAQFLKYESYYDNDSKEWKNICRAQDIVSIANIAKENNSKYEYTTEDESDGYYYIRVIVKKSSHTKSYDNFEAESLEEYKEFLRKYSGEEKTDTTTEKKYYEIIYFKCTNVEINPESKRVCSVTFEQL